MGGRLKQVDIEYMKAIHELCNIIPVIIQPDLSLKPEIRIQQRLTILSSLKTNQIQFSHFGYNDDDEELISAIKEPMIHPYCPPFILDYSPSKQLFHGLLSLKQAILQYQYKQFKYDTTEKFILWRRKKKKRQQQQLSTTMVSPDSTTAVINSTDTTIASSTSLLLSSTGSQEQQLKKIKISQYITKRRHSLERELLLEEKKLQQEFESTLKVKKMEIILKELNLMINQQSEDKKIEPMIYYYSNYGWIFLSILLSIFICYQNRHFLLLCENNNEK